MAKCEVCNKRPSEYIIAYPYIGNKIHRIKMCFFCYSTASNNKKNIAINH